MVLEILALAQFTQILVVEISIQILSNETFFTKILQSKQKFLKFFSLHITFTT